MWRNSNGYAVINVTKYHRMLKGDATYTTSGNISYYEWEYDAIWEVSIIRSWMSGYSGGMNQKGTY